MNFLAPALLWGLLAAAIPVIIHLLNRRRFRTVKWAATTFLLKASRESRGKKRLKHILILACRGLAIAALIFAVARPLVGNFLGWGGGSVETVVLVLDRSPSMEIRNGDGQPSQREAVLQRIAETIKNMGQPRLVLIDSATQEIQDVASPDVLPDLSTTQATDTQADIPGLLTRAIDYLQETKPGRAEIWLASDLQRGDWKTTDNRWQVVQSGIENLPTKTKLRILSADSKKRQNFALELLSSRRIADDIFLDLRISRTETTGDASVALTFSLNGARSSERVTITGQEARFQKRLPLGAGESRGHGWVGLTADNNPRDNAAFFAYGAKRNIVSYLVTDSPSDEAARFLKRAAAPLGFTRNQCDILTPVELSKIDWSTSSLVIWQAALPRGAAAAQLTQFVEAGGSVLFAPPAGPSTESIFGISWGEVELAPDDQFFITGPWVPDDGPWAHGVNGTPLPLKELRSVKRRKIEGEGAVLAEWDDKSPLLLRHLTGKGTAIFMGTLPDERWSNLEFTALHLVGAQRLIQKGTERLHSGSRALAGSEKAMTKNDEIRERLDTFEDYEPSLTHYRSGIYRLGERIVAVNRKSDESGIEVVTEDGLKDLLGDTSYSLFSNDNTEDDFVKEAWRAFLVAVLLFLIAEALLCLQPKPGQTPIKGSPEPSPAS
ncbi:BatA domain-containing protein [Akkermansiaceae bacterium]|nr:BatA domain-containing protein [Akkermansiaceae bacterium]